MNSTEACNIGLQLTSPLAQVCFFLLFNLKVRQFRLQSCAVDIAILCISNFPANLNKFPNREEIGLIERAMSLSQHRLFNYNPRHLSHSLTHNSFPKRSIHEFNSIFTYFLFTRLFRTAANTFRKRRK